MVLLTQIAVVRMPGNRSPYGHLRGIKDSKKPPASNQIHDGGVRPASEDPNSKGNGALVTAKASLSVMWVLALL